MDTEQAKEGLEPIRSLEGRYYTDPALYARERDGLLAQSWQFAGHVSQLTEVGDFFTLEVAEQQLFCIKTQDGTIRTFYNVCQHRAHELVQGKGNKLQLTCPYHAWTYELDGSFRAGPNTRVVPGFRKQDICLSSVRTEVFCGFVFVNLEPQARPMAEWFPNVEQELREFVPQIDRLRPLQWVEVQEHCNWKVSVENYSECYHCTLNHPTFATGVIDPKTYNVLPQGHCLRHTTESQNLERMSYPIDLANNPRAGAYSSWYLWPLFSFQVYPGNLLNTYHWRVKGVDEVVVWRGWYSIDGAEDAVVRRLAAQDRATTVEEDIRLVEAVQRGLRSKGYRPGPLVLDPAGGLKSEHSVQVLQQWVREAIDG
ncbi:MAG: aromatic ring-hydroxylating dioxygenase subunit alpha [Burkholderiaceae bacterium]